MRSGGSIDRPPKDSFCQKSSKGSSGSASILRPIGAVQKVGAASVKPALRVGRTHDVLGATRDFGVMEGKAGCPAKEFVCAQTRVSGSSPVPFPRSDHV